MGIVHIEKLKDDMVLSEDVRDANYKLLLAKGQKIQSKHIRIFKIWGITEVSVVGSHGREEISESYIEPEIIEKTKEDIKYTFQHVDLSHPAIKELCRLSVLYRSRHKILNTDWNITFAKPEDLKNHSIYDVKKRISDKEIKLPETPSIVFELNEIISDPSTSAHDIAQVVGKSPSLAALLLRIVNSSFYGFPSKIDSITRAVTMIGTREITALALGINVIDIFKDIPREVLDMNSFLRHSLACGIISRILATNKNIPQTEQLFVSGLLHDIGRLIVYKYFPDQAARLLNLAAKSDKVLYQLEKSCLGGTHTLIGKYLLKKWKLPLSLENNVVFHHNPSSAQDPVRATLVHFADIMVNALGIGSSGERFVAPFDYKAWDNLGISPGSFETVIRQATHQLASLETFFQSQE